MAASVWIKSARLARIIRIRVRPVDRAHNAAGDGEAEIAEGVADGQHGLSRHQFGRVAPGDRGQIFGVDLDHGQICKLVGANYLGREGAAVMQRYPHFHRAIDHVIVGHDVSIRGDDHTAANAVLNLPLALPLARHTVAELLAESGAEELGERIIALPLIVTTFGFSRLLRARGR